jgi:hypothetical protein
MEGSENLRIYRGDKWTRILGSLIPLGTSVKVLKFCYRRRVIVEYQNKPVLTMLWCLVREKS